MPQDLHDPESGRRAAAVIKAAIAELRPDVAATALIEGITDLGTRIEPQYRFQFWVAFDTILLSQKLRKGVM